MEGISGPPGSAVYKKENIAFIADAENRGNTIMQLATIAANTFASMQLARIETKELLFREGTFAARVAFDNAPNKWQDGNVQTFYAINVLEKDNDPDYSECDFEYTPWDTWSGIDHSIKMHFTTWETYQNEPWIANYAHTAAKGSYEGWQILVFAAVDGKTVDY